jgi:hypothetical protein
LVTEGKAGMPLSVIVQVQSESCAPLNDVAVDVSVAKTKALSARHATRHNI